MTDPDTFSFAPGLIARARPGDRDKVLWLHPAGQDASVWTDLWQRLPDWHHIGIDLPGHGGSDPLSTDGDLKRLGQRLGAACVEHDVRHLVAQSFGTLAAMQVAMELPDQIASMVLAGALIAGGPQDEAAASQVFAGLDDEDAQRFQSPPHDEEDLARPNAEVLVLVGEDEFIACRATAMILEQSMLDCRARALDGVGHGGMLAAPEQAASLINAHLRANVRDPGP